MQSKKKRSDGGVRSSVRFCQNCQQNASLKFHKFVADNQIDIMQQQNTQHIGHPAARHETSVRRGSGRSDTKVAAATPCYNIIMMRRRRVE